jgi:limonene-1,2-epoxide hydrolase
MTATTTDQTDLDLARAFARAYREIDGDALRGLLAPTARVRVLMPRGYSEHAGPDEVISALREFAERWKTEAVDELGVELLAPNLMQTGRMAFVSQRFRLRSAAGDKTATMVVKHLIAIADGRVALFDELCSGVMPD